MFEISWLAGNQLVNLIIMAARTSTELAIIKVMSRTAVFAIAADF
jgi:hypothetical protein